MNCYIKSFKTFAYKKTLHALEWDIVQRSHENDISTVVVPKGEADMEDVGEWLIAADTLLRIETVQPGDETVTLKCRDLVSVFDRDFVWADLTPEDTVNTFIMDVLNQHFAAASDEHYAMPYLNATGLVAGDIAYHAPETDAYGVYSFGEYLRAAARTHHIYLTWSADGEQDLRITVGRGTMKGGSLVLGRGKNQLAETPVFSSAETARVSVLQRFTDENDEEQITRSEWFLYADGSYGTDSESAERVDGGWEIVTVPDSATESEISEKVATIFSRGMSDCKISFYSERDFTVGAPVRLRVAGKQYSGYIARKAVQSSDSRFLYQCGNLPVTLTDRIQRAEEAAETVRSSASGSSGSGTKGEKGEPGDDGITPTIGSNGNWFYGSTDSGYPSRGEKGDKGDTGATGAKGATGATGATGAKGEKGDPGEDGKDGEKGDPFTYDDFTAAQLAALKGDKGDKGDPGDPASNLITSVNGQTGEVTIGAEVVDGESITPSAVNVGDAAQLTESSDGRGVILLQNDSYPAIESLKAYANTDGSGGLMTRNSSGNQAITLSGSVSGMQSKAGGVVTYDANGESRTLLGTNTDDDGILRLKDSSGTAHILTPALVQKLIDGLTAEEIADALANKSDSSHTHDGRYYTESETNSLLSAYALKANIATTATYGISNSAAQYMKVSDFGNWGTGAWYQKGFSMLLTSRAGETVWVSVSSDDSGTNAKAFRIMNTYTKINGIWYSASESAIYCQMIAWCNNLNAHILSNVNGDYVPVISTASALPSDAKSINIVEFGVTSSGTQVGDTSVNLLLGGAADRPTYNSNAMALLSDVPATSSVAKLSETSDSRGVLTLKRADGTEALKAYALNSGAEIDMNDASGTTRAALYVSSEGDGKLKLTDSAGNNYTLTPALVQKLIDGLSASEIADALANKSDNSHTHAAATTSAAGFMSAADKSKLDGITASADAVSFSRSLTSGTKVGTLTINGTATDLYAPTNTDTTYSAATSSKLGLVKSGTDITVDSSGNVSVNDDSHNHVISNVDGLQTSLNDKASVSAANTYNGEQKFLHSQYCPNDNDIAYGVGAAYKASRGVVTQEIVGQIIMPNTAAADSYGCATDANIIKFQKITGTSAGIPTLETFASLTEEGFNAPNFTVGLSSTLSETSDSRGVLTLKNSAYDSIESLKAYANTDGSGGLMTRNSSGNQAVTLSGSVSGMQSKAGGVVTYDANGESRTLLGTNTDDDGILRLKDSSGTAHILTPAMIDLLNSLYPIGAIYMSTVSTSPALLFGGTWTQIKDRFLLAAGDTYAAGKTGGTATHELTIDEMPHHTHDCYYQPKSGKTGDVTVPQWFFYLYNTAWGQVYEDTSGYLASDNTYSGGGNSHNNMPPYLAVYIWKRTA